MRDSPNSSTSSCSRLPDVDLSRDTDPFPGQFDSAESHACWFVVSSAADICLILPLSELPTKLADTSDVKGIRPVTAFKVSSLLIPSTLAGVSEVVGFPLSAVSGGPSSLFLLVPIRVAGVPFFFSEVFFADDIAAFNLTDFCWPPLFFENDLTSVLPPDAKLLWSYSTPRRILTAVASLERETRQEQDGSKVSSLNFRPLKYLPTYF